ncbi:MAG TPA: hypothetical protein PLF78_09070, partial [Caulobacter sp.]|nr:hypothetical protein [Caulobacter sp.]
MLNRRHFALGTAGALVAGGAWAKAPAPQVEIEGARDLDQRLTIPVFVGEAGPFHFVVDTGADRTVLASDVADRL